jgi:hypothetical protein
MHAHAILNYNYIVVVTKIVVTLSLTDQQLVFTHHQVVKALVHYGNFHH